MKHFRELSVYIVCYRAVYNIYGPFISPYGPKKALGIILYFNQRIFNIMPETPNEKLIIEGFITVIAGPCAIESWEQIDSVAAIVKDCGLKFIRGGAYKPRTSPYSFQGLEEKGLQMIQKISKKYGLKTVTEVTDAESVELVAKYVDVLQIGTRNMSNFSLLKKVGRLQMQ